MGASGWSYFVPYQADIRKALMELRQDVFERGEYEPPFEPTPESEATQRMIHDQLRKKGYGPLLDLLGAGRGPSRPKATPRTIDHLLEQCAEDGTHSILDMRGVSAEPDFGTVSPLDEEDLTQVFGTIWPTREMAEAKLGELMDLSDRWVGTYLVLYKDRQPDEILFVGCSGD